MTCKWAFIFLAMLLVGCNADLAQTTPSENDFDLQPSPGSAIGASDESSAPQTAISTGRATWWKPKVGMTWQIQFNGQQNLSYKVQAYVLDLYDSPVKNIKTLHAQGVKVICYFSAGSYEDWRPDAGQFPDEVIGASNGWEGENWLDIRKIDALKPIMQARVNLAKQKGCDAVDADNVDGFTNETGFPLTYNDQLAYNVMLAQLAHAKGLAISLKNDLLQIEDLVDDFDLAINEQCLQYDECDYLTPFIDAGKPVLHIEYSGSLTSICNATKPLKFSSLKKRVELNAWMQACPN